MSSFVPPPPPPPPSFSSLRPPPRDNNVANKIMTFAAIGMGVGFGTCSVAGLAAAGHKIGQTFIVFGAGLFFVSLAVLFVTGLVMMVQAIAKSFKR